MMAEAKSKQKRVTQAELARAVGVSRAAVTKALRSGRVTAGADGRFDLERARADCRANTRQARMAGCGEHRIETLPAEAELRENIEAPFTALDIIATAHYILREFGRIDLPKLIEADGARIIKEHGYVPDCLKPKIAEEPVEYLRRLLVLGCIVLKRKVAEPAC